MLGRPLVMKITVTAGIILCFTGITLVHQNRWQIGLIAFVLGFLLMMYRKS